MKLVISFLKRLDKKLRIRKIKKKIYYIGGCEAFGDAGYMTLKKDKDKKESLFKIKIFH